MAKLTIILGWASFYALVNCAITTLYPLKAAELQIPESYIGQVLGIYSISSFVFLPISLWMLKRCSDLQVFQIGLTLNSLTLILVALLPFIKDASLFLTISFLFRIIEGSSDIMTNMSAMNLVQKAKNKDFYLNLMVGFYSIGGALGPFLVSLLIKPLGFTGFYLSLSGLVLASAIICIIFNNYFAQDPLKHDLLETLSNQDTSASGTGQLPLEVTDPQATDLSFLQILEIKRVLIGLLFFIVIASLWTFRDPVLPIYLKSLGVSSSDTGYFYMTQTLANALFGLTPVLFVKCASPRSIIIVGSLGITISLFLVGPSSILQLGNSLVTLQIGLGLLGATFNFACSPVISDMMEGIKEKYPWASNPQKLSLLYLAARSIGYWIGPLMGSILYEHLSFALTCDVFAIFFVFMICIYSNLICSIPRLCRPSQKKQVFEDSYRQLNGGNEANSYI